MRLEDVRFREKLLERVWERVDTSGPCWLWRGSAESGGYGDMSIALLGKKGSRHRIHAHRAVYLLACGEVPDDMCVCHHCDTPLCVRPSHLFLGTKGDNVHDMDHKGRRVSLRGFSINTAKLNEEKVVEIRRRFVMGESGPKLGRAFGVSSQMIYDIANHKYWKHVV